MKVKNDHRSKFSNLIKQLERRRLKKIRASTGFEPVSSALPDQQQYAPEKNQWQSL